MAEIVLKYCVTPLIGQAVSKAASFATDRVSLAWGLKEELEELSRLLTVLQQVLHAAEERQESNQPISQWLQQLENVAYDAVDVLDEYAYMVNRVKVETSIRMMKKVRILLSMARLKIAGEFKKIKESLVRMKSEAVFIQLIRSGDQRRPTTGQYPKTDSILPLSLNVFEREQDVLDIVSMLQHLRTQNHLSGISISGMAGVGKTTLAKSVYNVVKDQKVLYDLVAWVCVSEDFNAQQILLEILEHFSGSGSVGGINSMNVLLHQLARNLEDKNLLLVLDDVWNRDSQKWEDLKTCLLKVPGVEPVKGLDTAEEEGKLMRGTTSVTKISIVITTRDEQAASILESSIPMHRYAMKIASQDICWFIIKETVLRSSILEKSLPLNLEVIGKDIAKKCGGLPLVASIIGGTLSRYTEEDKWSAIRDNDAWEDRDKILSILKISFDHLLPALKKCFAYCSIFPKDFVIEKDDLIQLWMAQGFLYQSNKESAKTRKMTVEEIGEEYVNELLSISLFQDVTRDDDNGNVISFKMHDVVHDLAVFVSDGETLVWEPGLSSIDENSKIRHLRVKGKLPPTIPKGVAKRLHSLFLDVDVFHKMPCVFKALRCLRLQGVNAEELPLPASLGKLKHLKYLSISENGIQALPQSFSKLYNLQTLKLLNCYYHEKLPDGFTNLISLRHIHVTFKEHMVDQLPSILSRGIGQLTSLQKLPVTLFDLGGKMGCRIDELGSLKELGGNLFIWNLEMVKSKSEAIEANLMEKSKLDRLLLSWDGRNRKGNHKDEEVLEGLQPPSNLKYLSIFGYDGESFPSWLTGGTGASLFQLNNLVELTFANCNGCTSFPGLGLLPNLHLLSLRRMENVRTMGHMFNPPNTKSNPEGIRLYPKLRSLTLSSMYNLEEWVEVAEDAAKEESLIVFPCLEQVLIEHCPSLRTLPSGLLSRITFGDGASNPEELEEYQDAIGSEEDRDESGTEEFERDGVQDANESEGLEEEEFQDAEGSEELDESDTEPLSYRYFN